jgi:hypothetical protein
LLFLRLFVIIMLTAKSLETANMVLLLPLSVLLHVIIAFQQAVFKVTYPAKCPYRSEQWAKEGELILSKENSNAF